jgi:hypothetical protein
LAVALDATNATGLTGAAATSTGSIASGITVGAGANRILVVGLQFGGLPGAITVCNWDSGGTPQAMTQIGTIQAESDNLGSATLFALINPTAGAKNISVTWTNSVSWTIGLASFTGADQGSVAGTCINFVSGNPTTGTAANDAYPHGGVAINSPVNDACVLFAASNNDSLNGSGTIGTKIYALNTNITGAGTFKLGAGAATSIAVSRDAFTTNNPACYVGCDIAAVGTVGGTIPLFDASFPHIIRPTLVVGY